MGGRRLEAALPRNPGRSHRIYHRPLGVDTMVKAALRTVAGLIVAVLLSALMVMEAPIASAQEPAPAPIPAAPEGFPQIGRPHVSTPGTNAPPVCRLLLAKQ